MSPPSFSKYIAGQRMPGGNILQRIAQLGVNVNWLLGGGGDMLADPIKPRRADPVVREAGKVYGPEGNGSAGRANGGSRAGRARGDRWRRQGDVECGIS